MKYIDEVCSVLSDEVERRYLRIRDAVRASTVCGWDPPDHSGTNWFGPFCR